MRKVADASGAKYSAGSSSSGAATAPPPVVKTKPVFTPTSSSSRADPIVAARSRRADDAGDDGWGNDAPQVNRTEIEKVDSAYKPTKVNMAELTKQKPETSRFAASSRQDDEQSDVVKGGYQPIGKVDIAAIRAAAQKKEDDRPAPVKGAYEPVGKIDIAAIKAKAQKPPPQEVEEHEEPRPVSDRAAAFSQPAQSERLTSLPKPKVANKFGGSSFSGTKAPTPSGLGLGGPTVPSAAPVGAASRTFADQGGKTPAQIWAEKKAKERGSDGGASVGTPSGAAPVESQKSGEGWKSGYTGKSWAAVNTSGFGRPDAGQLSQENTGEDSRSVEDGPGASASGVSALKDRFKDTAPIGIGAAPIIPRAAEEHEPARSPSPPPVPDTSRPSGGFALPGLPSRPAPADEEEEDDDPSAYQPVRDPSPVRVAIPVSRGVEREATPSPPPIAPSEINVPKDEDLSDEREQSHAARGAGEAVARQEFEPEQIAAAQGGQGGHKAIVQYDYDKAEDNEIELLEGQLVVDIDMVDDDWWLGTNVKGERGLFPSNYVELSQDAPRPVPVPAPAPVAAEPSPPLPPPVASRPAPSGPTATALYDYEAAEDNGMLYLI